MLRTHVLGLKAEIHESIAALLERAYYSRLFINVCSTLQLENVPESPEIKLFSFVGRPESVPCLHQVDVSQRARNTPVNGIKLSVCG